MPESPVPTAAVVLFRKDEVLLVRDHRPPGRGPAPYGLPGGHLQEGETEAEAALRELREETGLRVRRDEMVELPTRYQAPIRGRLYRLVVFWAPEAEGELTSCEETIPHWAKLSELEHLPLLPNVREAIEEAWRLWSARQGPSAPLPPRRR